MPKTLYDDVIEIDERVVPYNEGLVEKSKNRIEVLPNNQKIEILKELDLEIVENELKKIKNEKNITNIAVVLMHSYL
jgi:N-methylhydantoinase A/oxoprolinase/acetone carboxylase beta subunit